MRKLSPTRKAIYIVSAIMVLLIVVLVAVCCDRPKQDVNRADGDTKLIRIGGGTIDGSTYTIVYDVDTGVEYVFTGEGLFPLYAKNGVYKIYEAIK